MKKKVLKEQQQETREIVKQIFNLALAINPNDTRQDTTGNNPTVSVRFSGIIAGVEVHIYPTGWDDGALPYTPSISYLIYLDDESFTACVDEYEPYPEEKECKQLAEAKAALAELQKIADKLIMCDICRGNPCAPTCPNAEPDLTANDEYYHRIEFCSEECLRRYYEVEEEEA